MAKKRSHLGRADTNIAHMREYNCKTTIRRASDVLSQYNVAILKDPNKNVIFAIRLSEVSKQNEDICYPEQSCQRQLSSAMIR